MQKEKRSPRSTVPLLRGAGEEAHSPAGGARGVGGVVEGGRGDFINVKIMISSMSAFSEMGGTLGKKPRTLHF